MEELGLFGPETYYNSWHQEKEPKDLKKLLNKHTMIKTTLLLVQSFSDVQAAAEGGKSVKYNVLYEFICLGF